MRFEGSDVEWTVTPLPADEAQAALAQARLAQQAGESAVAIYGEPVSNLHEWIGWVDGH